MHRLSPVVVLFTTLALAACSTDAVVSPLKVPTGPKLDQSAAIESGSYLVLLKGNGIPKGFARAVADLGGTVTSTHAGVGFATVSGLTDETAAQLAGTNGVGEVQRNTIVELDTPIELAQADVSQIESDPSIQSQGNPAAAALITWQWNLKLIGADSAWRVPIKKLGDSTVRVAIIDTGIDYDDRDFFRPATAAAPEARLVDLSTSISFVPSDEAIRADLFPTRNAISDFHGHGTNVASQVSSLATFFAGVTSQTKLVGVKVLSARGSGTLDAVLNGVLWAADHNVDIANMSLGSSFSKAGNGQRVALINRVFNYAKQKGMLIVVAAGNAPLDGLPTDIQHNGNEYINYCDAPHVICVAAVGPLVPNGPADLPALYSNYGKSKIDVAAPGGNVSATFSRWPWGISNGSAVWSLCSRQQVTFTAAGRPVRTSCGTVLSALPLVGTSQAAPHVAGLAALLVHEYGRGQPQLIKHLIERSSDPIADPGYGRGRISVINALGL